ncbi:hypothetical protein M422DRAFT_779731 [Sphaerobolus stellatus SS14]|uniref:F-box domain-containing protein n=1 Tax=Sphaerobolus stellatus (strain SS14) TaxID=990650 RepID=A0A0C9VYY0_SPHS4|nr:hypothetical protein M422DRAFT_779731 [Sphaerobolus stellatus SS14]
MAVCSKWKSTIIDFPQMWNRIVLAPVIASSSMPFARQLHSPNPRRLPCTPILRARNHGLNPGSYSGNCAQNSRISSGCGRRVLARTGRKISPNALPLSGPQLFPSLQALRLFPHVPKNASIHASILKSLDVLGLPDLSALTADTRRSLTTFSSWQSTRDHSVGTALPSSTSDISIKKYMKIQSAFISTDFLTSPSEDHPHPQSLLECLVLHEDGDSCTPEIKAVTPIEEPANRHFNIRVVVIDELLDVPLETDSWHHHKASLITKTGNRRWWEDLVEKHL